MDKINKNTEEEILRIALEALGKNVPAHTEIETLAPDLKN